MSQTQTNDTLPGRQEKKGISENTRKAISIAAFVVFLAFSAAAVYFIGRPLVRYLSQPEDFRLWVDMHGFWGRLAFIGMMVLQIVVALIPGEVLEVGAGYAFGFWEGTLLCIIGAVVGSVLVFLLVRWLGVKLVEVFFPIERIHSLKFLNNTRRLNLLVFIIYFIPGTPKDLLAYFVGLTPMRLGTWVLITAVARLPSIVTSTAAGAALGIQRYWMAAIVMGATLLASGAGLLIYRAISRRQNNAAKNEAEAEPSPETPQK